MTPEPGRPLRDEPTAVLQTALRLAAEHADRAALDLDAIAARAADAQQYGIEDDGFEQLVRNDVPALINELRRLADEPASAGLGVSATPSHTDQAFVLWLDASDGSVPTHDGIVWPDGTATIHHRHFGHTTTHADAEAARQAAHGKQGRIVWPEPADRAAVLREAADAVFALDYDDLVSEQDDENLGSMREAWDLGTIHASQLLRRLADEAPQQPAHSCGNCEGIDPASCPTNPDRTDEAQQPDTEAWDVPDARPGTTDHTLTRPAAAARPEPPVHGESVAHLAGLHDNEPAVEVRQDGSAR